MSSFALLESPLSSNWTAQPSGPLTGHAPCGPRRRAQSARCLLGLLFCSWPETGISSECGQQNAASAPAAPAPTLHLSVPLSLQMAADTAVKAAPGQRPPGQLWTREGGPAGAAHLGGSRGQRAGSQESQRVSSSAQPRAFFTLIPTFVK